MLKLNNQEQDFKNLTDIQKGEVIKIYEEISIFAYK